MAFSATKVSTSVAGNLKMEVWSFNSASVTTGAFTPGMGQVHHVSLNNQVTEADGKAVVSLNNLITLSGLTADDTGTVLVVGV